MSQEAALTAAVAANTKATQDAVAALGSVASANTPDSVVSAAVGQINANSAALEAVAVPPTP